VVGNSETDIFSNKFFAHILPLSANLSRRLQKKAFQKVAYIHHKQTQMLQNKVLPFKDSTFMSQDNSPILILLRLISPMIMVVLGSIVRFIPHSFSCQNLQFRFV